MRKEVEATEGECKTVADGKSNDAFAPAPIALLGIDVDEVANACCVGAAAVEEPEDEVKSGIILPVFAELTFDRSDVDES